MFIYNEDDSSVMKNINWIMIAMYTFSASIMFYILIVLADMLYAWIWRI